MKKLNLLIILAGIFTVSITSCQDSHSPVLEDTEQVSSKNSAAVNQLIAQVRQATTQYLDPDAAIAAGYTNTIDCFTSPSGEGAMGVHFINFDLIDGTFDPLEPEALVYEIRNDGSYKLVAVEYLYNGNQPAMFAGEVHFHPLPLPIADYALHVWSWKANPAGIFEDWNVNVTCP